MDRSIFYPSEVLLDSDLLTMNKNALIGLGYALQDLLGVSTLASGLPCAQTTVASLNVVVGPGRIYSLQNVDGSAYGSLPADTTDQIVKQGIQFGSVTLATPAPASAGQSINYLIEASYQDVDTNATVLNFYNAANPLTPLVGPSGSGAPLNTQRKGTIVVQAKAGVPATTGTQTTPAADSGFIGLWVVTVANGQSTVTAANISLFSAANFTNAIAKTPVITVKAATTSRASNTTLANDPDLVVALPAAGTYRVTCLLNVPVLTGGFDYNLNYTGTVVSSMLSGGANGGAALSVSQTPGAVQAAVTTVGFTVGAPSTGPSASLVEGIVTVSTAGTLALAWAQHSSSATASQLVAGSAMTVTRIA